jgi:coenzyme PQQ synthesis protein D (PqqD)
MTVLEDRGIPASLMSNESRLQQAPRISAAWCGDELVLLDATTGRYFTLNRVGGRMWELLATPRSAGDLVVCLRMEYNVRPATGDATLEQDVVRMLDNMLKAGLLVAEKATAALQSRTSNLRRGR